MPSLISQFTYLLNILSQVPNSILSFGYNTYGMHATRTKTKVKNLSFDNHKNHGSFICLKDTPKMITKV